MKNLTTILIAAAAAIATACCGGANAPISVVPAPQSVEMKSGTFSVAGASLGCEAGLDARTLGQVSKLAETLSTVTGQVSEFKSDAAGAAISFVADAAIADEAYAIEIGRKAVKVSASSFNGFLYAIQTIKQMLPAAIFGGEAAPSEAWTLPCCTIKDSPRFAYRGQHLDVARHFFSVEEVEKVLDVMALHKLNRLHWHLTEDQGWRIEIKKYPKLTEIGSKRAETVVGKNFDPYVGDGQPYGGFYTQDQVREIVAYADNLGITVIPEIDLPGHMLAALASYPELGCTGKNYKVWTTWGISNDVLCVGKESTFTFLEDVLTELMDLFPSEYIHIGGDECPKVSWENCPLCQKKIAELGYKDDGKHSAEQYLQSYVTARIQKFLNDHGRKIIGWDEILEGDLAKGATVMSWRGVAGGIEAASKGFDAIMTPNSYMYIDYYQSDKTELEPLAIGGYLPVDTVYSYEPLKGIPDEAKSHILGVQSNLWTEYVGKPEHLEYMLLPRMAALSEVQWCAPENKDFDRFKASVIDRLFPIYDKMGFTYCKAIKGEYGLPGIPGGTN